MSTEQAEATVTITVNNKSVVLAKHRVTGMEIKEAAIVQGVDIEPDFILTLEAFEGQTARNIDDDEPVTVTKHSVFIANDGDDDS
jgi:Multiubiquitin